MENTGPKRSTEREVIERLRGICGYSDVQQIGRWVDERRDKAVTQATKSGIPIRQLSRLTGINKAITERIARGH